jgi:hypothetical protein
MTKRKKPGERLRPRSLPRHRGEILCHNNVLHVADTRHGERGFRFFVARRGRMWVQCPCGWQPAKGIHYASPEEVKHWRARIKKHGGLDGAYRDINLRTLIMIE